MKVSFRDLERQLRDRPGRVYLVAGDEPLLVDEALENVRESARARGFDARELHFADRNFDWTHLTVDADTLSLFANRKIVEVRLASPRPGTHGAEALAALAANQDPDRVLIVAAGGRPDGRVAWVKAFERYGVYVEIWPVTRHELPGWIESRARRARLSLTPDAVAVIAERVEGNLLAADQEIKRLAILAGGAVLDEQKVLESVADNARFDVYLLSDAVLAGDVPRAFRVLSSLRAEGVAAPLVCWALAREIVVLAQLQFAAAQGESIDAALFKSGVWRSRHALVKQALARYRRRDFRALVAMAAEADATIKGAAPGEPWEALTGLLLAILWPPGAAARA